MLRPDFLFKEVSMSDYTQMWSDLGLDLKAHDAFLSILGGAYKDVFLSQKDAQKG
jgi:hypothetical protein